MNFDKIAKMIDNKISKLKDSVEYNIQLKVLHYKLMSPFIEFTSVCIQLI